MKIINIGQTRKKPLKSCKKLEKNRIFMQKMLTDRASASTSIKDVDQQVLKVNRRGKEIVNWVTRLFSLTLIRRPL